MTSMWPGSWPTAGAGGPSLGSARASDEEVTNPASRSHRDDDVLLAEARAGRLPAGPSAVADRFLDLHVRALVQLPHVVLVVGDPSLRTIDSLHPRETSTEHVGCPLR